MKGKIKKTSINLFYKKGYFATSMSTIARSTGIQKSSIYHHYSTKEDILLDIFRTSINDLQDALERRLDAALGASERMQAAIYCHIIFQGIRCIRTSCNTSVCLIRHHLRGTN